MKVRNCLISKKEYKGRWTEAKDEHCPCRPCYNAHDCGETMTGPYGLEWKTRMECATRWSYGCGDYPDPEHVAKRSIKKFKSGQKVKCHRCNTWVELTVGMKITSLKDGLVFKVKKDGMEVLDWIY